MGNIIIDEYVDKMNTFLNSWLSEHDFECEVEFSTNFGYDYKRDIIYYSIFVPEYHSDYFLDIYQRCDPRIGECDNFILSFFHELGHFNTLHYASEDDWESYEYVTHRGLDENQKDVLYDYYTHPIELMATQWGAQYIVNNSMSVKKFFIDFQNILKEFYKKMEVDCE